MRTVLALSVGAVLACALTARDARAAGAIVTVSPGASVMTEARVASSPNAMWASVTVQGVAPEFVWLVPLPRGAQSVLASDAWLESLDDATAPRVVSPSGSSSCSFAPAVENKARAHAATQSPNAIATAADGDALDAALESWHVTMTSDVRNAAREQIAAGAQFVALKFASTGASTTTRTLRVTGEWWAPLPFALSRGWGSDVPVTAFVIGASRATFNGIAPLMIDPGMVGWQSSGSTYDSLVNNAPTTIGGQWIVQAAGSQTFLSGQSVPNGMSIPSLSSDYAARVAAYEDGDADDLNIALDGGTPVDLWVTRGATHISRGAFGRDVNVGIADGDAVDPVIEASLAICGSTTPSGSGYGSSSGSNASTVSQDPSNDNGAAAATTAIDVAQVASDSCDMSGSDGCSSDTSEDDSSSCDSSSSDSSDGCSGSGSDGGSGGCSGGGDSGSCHVSRHGRKRSPISRLLLGFVAFAVPLRRMTRRRATA